MNRFINLIKMIVASIILWQKEIIISRSEKKIKKLKFKLEKEEIFYKEMLKGSISFCEEFLEKRNVKR